jgi:hypothetical protein
MSKTVFWLCCCFMVLISGSGMIRADDQREQSHQTKRELEAYWAEVSRSVREGDFSGYSKTCHPQGVLVSGIKKSSYPLTQALEGWKQGFDDTRTKIMKASVDFRFSQRLYGPTTAHETGIFRYASTRDGLQTITYVHFEGLLQKSPAGWKIVMEYQKSAATEAEWNALAPKIDQESKR